MICRRLRLVVIVAVLAVLVSSYGLLEAQTKRKVTVTWVAPSIAQSVAWLAKEVGIFAKHGVDADVILLTGSPRAIQTLLAGDIDYAIAGAQAAMRARMRGADPVIVATTSNVSSQRVLVRPDSSLKRLEDLKGKTVGITQYGSAGDSFFRSALRKVGLRPDTDVAILQMGGTPQVSSALVAGKTDAGVTGESGLLLVHQGRLKELAGASAKELKLLSSGATLTTTQRYINRDRSGIMQFMRAYVEGVHYFKTNRDGTLRALQKYLRGATAEQIALLYDDQRDVTNPLPVPSEEALQADLDRESDPKAKTFKPADFVDLSFLREVEKSGLVAELYSKGSMR